MLPMDMICPNCLIEMVQHHLHGSTSEYRCNCGFVVFIDEDRLYQEWAREVGE